MSLIKIPVRAYAQLANILGFGGSIGIVGIQDETIPVQDLTRILQDARVQRTLFQLTEPDVAATGSTDMQWNDRSDWTEVWVNGIEQQTDDALPQRNQTRVITSVSLQVAGTQADYTVSALYRRTATAIVHNILLAQFDTLVTSLNNAVGLAPTLLPQWLQLEENTVRWQKVVSAGLSDLSLTIEMISAERGILHPGPWI